MSPSRNKQPPAAGLLELVNNLDARSRQEKENWFSNEIEQHIANTREHFARVPANSQAQHVPPSNALWSGQEQALFFRSIRRHSRWRPDLIAQDVGKTEAEVTWYASYIEGNIARRSGRKPSRAGAAPAAYEVSERWIAHEEEISVAIKDSLRSPPADQVRIRHGSSTIHAQRRRRAERVQAELEFLKQQEKTEWLADLTAAKLRDLDALVKCRADGSARSEEDALTLQGLQGRKRTAEEQMVYRRLSEAARHRAARRKARIEARGNEVDDPELASAKRKVKKPDKAVSSGEESIPISDRMTRTQIDNFVKHADDEVSVLAALEGPLTAGMAKNLGIDVENSLFDYGSLSHFSTERSIDHRVLDILSALVRHFVARLIYDLIPFGDVTAEHVEAVLSHRDLAGGLDWDVPPAFMKHFQAYPSDNKVGDASDHHDAFPWEAEHEGDNDFSSGDELSADEEHCELEEAQEVMDKGRNEAYEAALWREESSELPESSDVFEATRKLWDQACRRRSNLKRKRKLKKQLGIYRAPRRILSEPYIDLSGDESESSGSDETSQSEEDEWHDTQAEIADGDGDQSDKHGN